MQKDTLAQALRQRQHQLGQVPADMIDALSDDAIIKTSEILHLKPQGSGGEERRLLREQQFPVGVSPIPSAAGTGSCIGYNSLGTINYPSKALPLGATVLRVGLMRHTCFPVQRHHAGDEHPTRAAKDAVFSETD